MKSFQIFTLFAMIAATMAFAPNKAPQVAQRFAESGFDMKKAAIAAIPAAIATPAFAMDSIVEALPTQTLSLEVQFGAYLAVLLGTFLPVLFLINLYIQTESRKAGRDGGIDSE
jgi:photosystem II PsbM protein